VLCASVLQLPSSCVVARLMEAAAATALVPPARRQVLILALLLLMAASMARPASSGESPGREEIDLACILYT